MRMNATTSAFRERNEVRKARVITRIINKPRSPRGDKYKAP